MRASIRGRLLLTSTLVLAAFVALTGLVLERAFRGSAEAGEHDYLQSQIYGLLAAADLNDQGHLVIAGEIGEPRLASVGSGLYAEIINVAGVPVWQSRSLLGTGLTVTRPLAPGGSVFRREVTTDGVDVFALHYGVNWQDPRSENHRYTFTVAEGLRRFRGELNAFRHSLWLWLAGAAAALLVAQGVILHWGLLPLRRVADEIHEVEAGKRKQLSGEYPTEIAHLTGRINRFIANEREHLGRYRRTLGDLAHSLKTPLAVLRGWLENHPEGAVREAQEQIDRMTNIVDYQLHRAAAAGPTTMSMPIPVAASLSKILASLAKVYADRRVSVAVRVDPQLQFFGEQGDLLEVLGNLLDNAYKWCGGRIEVQAEALDPAGSRPGLRLVIDDDGPGVPADAAVRITERGVSSAGDRGGQGIGLSVVRDIVESYRGRLTIGANALGGARVEVDLPA